ncbi:SH3 domain-containing protein [Mesorhizobium sp. B2-4-17]|uniref:SH3 domain-containing protein n=1 Tax=Mesorhizobium sp. B2-4-17 TaxID=2589932 RepID=UPI00112C5223|nr:SH3 domain-containing protein [Mesorhizobium sp. B2-4-17]TPK86253.1 SH3 domain-containing protein [Mesorhizobium sp. B2-4-17]
MKRRTVTLRKSLHALIAAAPLLMAAWQAVVPAHAEEAPFISIVTGLAPDDLLNVRTKPSPIGKTETRLAAGASVRNLGCNDIDGHQWCKIVSDNPRATGWAPARYLVPVNPATVPDADQQADAGAEDEDAAADANTDGDRVVSADPAQPPLAPPADLAARLGRAAHPAAPETPMKSAADTAMQDAYGLALAAAETPSTGEVAAPAVPAAHDPLTVAELPHQSDALASGGSIEIPCARNVGQPMTRCAATVLHKGTDKAEVTVTWPDGGTRVISFDGGRPAGSDAKGDFRFTREGSLSMIRIGVSERFEITDAVAFGK